MEIDPKERSRVWWSGAVKGIGSGIATGLLVAGVAAAVLLGITMVAPASWGLVGLFAPFLSLPGVTLPFLPEIASTGLSFLPVPLAIFNTALTVASNMLSGGDIAVVKYQQEMDHAKNEARISAIEGREQAMGQVISNPRSLRVDSIIRNGPRPLTVDSILRDGPTDSHAAAEEARENAAPTGPTLH